MCKIISVRERLFLLTIISTALFLCGCIQSKEHLTINKDGSGTLLVETMVPKATTEMIDEMMGPMMQLMPGEETTQMPERSMAEEMFANKDEVLQKAVGAGAEVKFIYFNKEIKDDGLYVQYKFEFDDVNKILKADIIGTEFELSKDTEGNLVCSLKSDPEKAQESKMQLDQISKPPKGPEEMTEEERQMYDAMVEAMGNLKMEFIITMPDDITEISGMFKKKDPKTAYLEFSGDLLSDPELIESLYGMSTEPAIVICSSEGLTFEPGIVTPLPPRQIPKAFKEEPLREEIPEGPKSRIYLKSGSVLEGCIVEQTDEIVKVNVFGIIFTYSRDEIAEIENKD